MRGKCHPLCLEIEIMVILDSTDGSGWPWGQWLLIARISLVYRYPSGCSAHAVREMGGGLNQQSGLERLLPGLKHTKSISRTHTGIVELHTLLSQEES